MKGDKEVLDALNEILMAELTGINIYHIHYMMQEDWGYKKIASHSKDESMGEMKRAHKIIERIIYFDGVPNMSKYDEVLVGDDGGHIDHFTCLTKIKFYLLVGGVSINDNL